MVLLNILGFFPPIFGKHLVSQRYNLVEVFLNMSHTIWREKDRECVEGKLKPQISTEGEFKALI